MEIEKKYLVKNNYQLINDFMDTVQSERYQIEQFYVQEEDIVARYRSRDNVYFRTVKSGKGLVREEDENEITHKEFHEAAGRFKEHGLGNPISKTRMVFDFENYVYELDIFNKNLSPLIMLEVEFKTKEEALAHTLPKELEALTIKEVTEDSRYVNQVLAQASREEIIEIIPTYQ